MIVSKCTLNQPAPPWLPKHFAIAGHAGQLRLARWAPNTDHTTMQEASLVTGSPHVHASRLAQDSKPIKAPPQECADAVRDGHVRYVSRNSHLTRRQRRGLASEHQSCGTLVSPTKQNAEKLLGFDPCPQPVLSNSPRANCPTCKATLRQRYSVPATRSRTVQRPCQFPPCTSHAAIILIWHQLAAA